MWGREAPERKENFKMADVYEIITSQIITQLEAGVVPWNKPWFGAGGAVSHASGRPYSLMNQMLIGDVGEFITFKQVEAAGGKVKKGAKSKIVIYYKAMEKPDLGPDGAPRVNPDGTEKLKVIPYIQYFRVFNINDCDGIKPKWQGDGAVRTVNPIDAAEEAFGEYLKVSGVKLDVAKGNEACYSPTLDRIKLPMRDQFVSSEEYYSTAFHEGVHSTGHPSRLNRFGADAGSVMFGSESYSKEELVAEIGACAALNKLGIDNDKTMRNSAAYVGSWLNRLKDDRKLIIEAASKAEKAIGLMFGEAAQGESKTESAA